MICPAENVVRQRKEQCVLLLYYAFKYTSEAVTYVLYEHSPRPSPERETEWAVASAEPKLDLYQGLWSLRYSLLRSSIRPHLLQCLNQRRMLLLLI